MATIETTTLTDDITGETADETVTFALDGTGYQIDLTDSNAKDLRAALAGYIESARRLGKVVIGSRTILPQARNTSGDRQHNQNIRVWAVANGHTVADRGRIPTNVVDAYNTAH